MASSSSEGVDTVVTGDKRLGALEETSSMASRIPSEALWVAFLNSLMPWPRPLASSGSLLAPNKIKTIARIKMISPPPKLNRANVGFIYDLVQFEDWEMLTIVFPWRSVFQSAEIGDQRLDIRVIEFLGKGRHFTFDPSFDDSCNSGIALGEVVEAGPFVPTSVISMARSAALIKQAVTSFRVSLQDIRRSDRSRIRLLFPIRIRGFIRLKKRRQ